MTDETPKPATGDEPVTAAEPSRELPKVELAISTDGVGATILVDGKELKGVTKYTMEHRCGELAKVTFQMYAEVTVKGPATVVEP